MKNLILEIERVQLIRKKCPAAQIFCDRCGEPKDFVRLSDIASLFGVNKERMLEFLRKNSCHYTHADPCGIVVCIASFLTLSQSPKLANRLRLVGKT